MQTVIDSLIQRHTPNAHAARDERRHCHAEKSYREKAIRTLWTMYLGDFFPIPVDPVGEWGDCLDTWADAPAENICLAISQAKRRYGHLKHKRRKKKEICEFIGRFARFGNNTYGLSRHGRDMVACAMAQQMDQYVAKQVTENEQVDRLVNQQVLQGEQMLQEGNKTQ